MSAKTRTFKPKRRKLTDLLLVSNSILFLIVAFQFLPPDQMMISFLLLNALVVLGWFFVVTPLTKITIENDTVTGHSPSFSKLSIPFQEIHQVKTNTPLAGFKRKLFKDIWSKKGQRIRLQRKFLGEGQVNDIMLTIEKHTFHSNAASF